MWCLRAQTSSSLKPALPWAFAGHEPKNSLISLSHLELRFCPSQMKSRDVGIFFCLKNHLGKKQRNKLVTVRVTTESPWVLWGTGLGRRPILSICLSKFSDYWNVFSAEKFNHVHTNHVTDLKDNRNSLLTDLNRFIYFLIILCHFKELEKKYQNIVKKKS